MPALRGLACEAQPANTGGRPDDTLKDRMLCCLNGRHATGGQQYSCEKGCKTRPKYRSSQHCGSSQATRSLYPAYVAKATGAARISSHASVAPDGWSPQ